MHLNFIPFFQELVKTNIIPLRETLFRLDSVLRRPNDYNEVIEESGEEDDQLSRYKAEDHLALRGLAKHQQTFEKIKRERNTERERANLRGRVVG
ncbi:hypothetical protein E2C01_063939 [Portunus trituberculatus]|uniref:Uncharacterized protein n=1 Tax=Portunus trituberculatus TaxID=210409 RepID=A0A5B7HLY2_PORTR|nr:hypothetical protein [Portunus trituberculatus]